MEKIGYDLVFGLGSVCGCSMTLRRARLQHLSFPGDWAAPIWYDEDHPRLQHDLRERASCLCRGLDGFFDATDFAFVQPHPWNGMNIYCNKKTRYYFAHDFPATQEFAAALPSVAAKYQRRYQRLVDLIRSSQRVLVVRMDIPSDSRPKATLDDCRFARQLLSETFAPTTFDFALLSYEKGRPYEKMLDERTDDGIYHFAFDFSNPEPGKDALLPNITLTAQLLASRFSVREYRTPEEIAAHKAAARRKKLAKAGVNSQLGYLWKKAVLALRGLSPFKRNA